MAKRIVLTVTNDLLQDQRMHRICSSLQRAGYDVELIGRKKKKSLPLSLQKYRQTRLNCWFEKGVFFYAEYSLRLLMYLLKKKHDLLYSVDLDTIGVATVVSKIKRTPHLHDAHEYFVEVPELQDSELKRSIWNWVAKWCYPQANSRFTVNQELANILSQRYLVDFGVLRNTPSTVKFECVEKSQKIILYQGMLNKGRGIEQIMKAMNYIDKDISLHIVGEGDLSEKLRNDHSKLSQELKERIKFIGWKSGAELQLVTKSAWLGLNLLEPGSLNYRYSLANKFFDYMHMRIPSINMNFPVYKRICNEFKVGVCIDSLDPKEIAGAINDLAHSHYYDLMVEACTKAIEIYNWEVEEQNLLTMIGKTIR